MGLILLWGTFWQLVSVEIKTWNLEKVETENSLAKGATPTCQICAMTTLFWKYLQRQLFDTVAPNSRQWLQRAFASCYYPSLLLCNCVCFWRETTFFNLATLCWGTDHVNLHWNCFLKGINLISTFFFVWNADWPLCWQQGVWHHLDKPLHSSWHCPKGQETFKAQFQVRCARCDH